MTERMESEEFEGEKLHEQLDSNASDDSGDQVEFDVYQGRTHCVLPFPFRSVTRITPSPPVLQFLICFQRSTTCLAVCIQERYRVHFPPVQR